MANLIREMDYSTEELAFAYKRFRSSNLIVPIRYCVNFQYFGDLTGMKIVDLGCGDGDFLKQCLARGALSCLGLDINDTMIRTGDNNSRDRYEYGYCDNVAWVYS